MKRIAVFLVFILTLLFPVVGLPDAKTYTTDADFLGFTSWDIEDEDWSDITDWTDLTNGTSLVEESPSGQLHVKAGDAGGTDSEAKKYKNGLITDDATFTIEFRVTFDQIANYAADIHGFWLAAYNGTNMFKILIHKDNIYYRTAAAWAKLGDDAIAVDTSYTYRLTYDSGTMTVYRDAVLIGTKADCQEGASANGRIEIGVYNWPAAPAETEAHIDNCKVEGGVRPPLVTEYASFLDTDIHAVANEIELSYDNEDTPAYHVSGTWTINYGAGAAQQWDNLSWNATENGTSNVKLRVRSAGNEAGLAAATWYPLAGYTEVSPYDMECPDNPWLQLEVTLERGAAADTPDFEDVTINWSTPPGGIKGPPGIGFGGYLMF